MKLIKLMSCLFLLTLGLTGIIYADSVQVIGLRGKVEIRQDLKANWTKAVIRIEVDENGWIKTGPKSAVVIRLTNNSKIKIGANSEVQIRSLKKSHTRIYLKKGSIVSKINKLRGSNKFTVRSPSAFAGVRGTLFYSSVQGSGAASKSLFCVKEGAVQVGSTVTKQTVLVTQGLGTQVAASGAPLAPKSVPWISQIDWTMDASVPISETPIKALKGGSSSGLTPSGTISGIPSLLGGEDDDDKKEKEKKEKEDSSEDFIFRLYGGYGFTSIADPSSGVTVDRSKTNWRGGLQFEYSLLDLSLLKLGIGIDAGFIRLYKDNTLNESPSVINTSAFVELELISFIIAQAGIGQYWGVKDFSGSETGIMAAGGLDIPIGNKMGLFLMIRMDVILATETITPLTGLAGFSFRY